MNTYLVVDISGKVLNYDYALCEAMTAQSDDAKIVLAAHMLDNDSFHGDRLKLLSIVPLSFKRSVGKIKRLLKAFEGIINYTVLLTYIILKHPIVVHFQWFPYLEFSSVEIPFVKILRRFSPNSKIIYTIHNVYPHSISQDNNRIQYKKRFMRMQSLIDHFIVHTESTADEVNKNFNIEKTKLSVVYHGIFAPNYKICNKINNPQDNKTIIFFGANRPNKGADILIDAIQLLSDGEKKRFKVKIVGRSSEKYMDELKKKANGIDVSFDSRFVPDYELYEMIDDADYIALPYREISQSGVLLLALFFEKPLLISNLPSFQETLKGFSDDMFFETGSAESMSALISRHLEGKVDVEKEVAIIKNLKTKYSWTNSAKKTLSIYNI